MSARDDRIEHLQAERDVADDGDEDTPAQQPLWRLAKQFMSLYSALFMGAFAYWVYEKGLSGLRRWA